MRVLWFMCVLSLVVFAKDMTPHLDKNEKLFKQTKLYKLKDFDFGWKVKSLSVFSFVKIYNENKKLNFKELQPIVKTKKVYTKDEKNYILYFANLMKDRKNYPIKIGYGPWGYRYYLVVFEDDSGKMFALENQTELKDMLGSINTPAELYIWILLKYYEKPYSYMWQKNIIRVRYTHFLRNFLRRGVGRLRGWRWRS